MTTSVLPPYIEAQILERGSNIETVAKQLERFKTGFAPTKIVKACTPDTGLIQLTEQEIERLIARFESELPKIKVVKFVPASGAASRMFKHLFYARDNWSELDENSSEGKLALAFIDQIEHFAFASDLEVLAQKEGATLSELKASNPKRIIELVLNEDGLNYGNLPKALIKFHTDEGRSKVSLEEHLIEAAGYAADQSKVCRLHFTVSPEHLPLVQQLCEEVKPHYEKHFGVTYAIEFSTQKKSTDTIAVDMDNEPFAESDGSILFRPAGHGALIENLNDIDADIVFLKNIDNVLPDHLKGDTMRYKKALGGYLLQITSMIASVRTKLEASEIELPFALEFCKKLGILPATPEVSKEELLAILNRPTRVCGMVKNEGEPGGGPFWVEDAQGGQSLQIVESAQIDLDNPEQKQIMEQSTHFNPVDVVCSVKDADGNLFDLTQFVDMDAGFITEKSKDGQSLKAQELPGLWNGSMAFWNTIFVEVPISTFSPVKTVNDLLKPVHQPA